MPAILVGRGGGVVAKVLVFLLLAAAVYFGVMLIPPYVENFKFDSALDAVARHSVIEKNDNVLLAMIQKEATTLGIQVLGDDISIQRDAEKSSISIRTRYRRVVVLKPFGATLSLDFSNDAQQKL
ncbi:MAG: hypothetical protein GYA21_08225 [Myxococcales bacterium]|nr:hypothetical protein [Myxococcales bacterium]